MNPDTPASKQSVQNDERKALGSYTNEHGKTLYIHRVQTRQQRSLPQVNDLDLIWILYRHRLPSEPPPLWFRYRSLPDNPNRRAKFQFGYRMLLEKLRTFDSYKDLGIAFNVTPKKVAELIHRAKLDWATSEGIDITGPYCWSENELAEIETEEIRPLNSITHAAGLEEINRTITILVRAIEGHLIPEHVVDHAESALEELRRTTENWNHLLPDIRS